MKSVAQASLFLMFAVVAGVVGVVVWFAIELVNRATAALDRLPWLFPAGAIVTFAAFVVVVVGGSIALVRFMALRSRMIHPNESTALYPQMYHGPARYLDLNADKSQVVAALSSGRRASAAVTQRVLDWQPEPAPVAEIPAPVAALTPSDVSSVDLRENPHFLLIGGTGSGKTTASYKLLGDLVSRNPTQVVITEPGGVNWSSQATATNTREIARAIGDVHSELVRRQDLLRAADCDHVRDLPEPLPFVILVVEEAEATLDDLRLTDRATRDATVIALRNLARMGRKCGISLVVCTQSGTADLLDTHMRRNFGTVLLFRSEHTIPEMWRLKGVKLSDLPPGAAYSVRHGAMVSFPMTARPVLPMLSAPSGIAVDDWPVPQNTGIPVREPVREAVSTPPSGIPVFGTDDNGPFTEAQAAHILRLYGSIGTIKGVQRAIYPDLEPGGAKWYALREVIEGRVP